MWWACSGGQQLLNSASEDQQFGVLVQRNNELNNTIIAIDIEKDLNRTFPNSNKMNNIKFLSSLRKVLYAYALRNPLLGYYYNYLII